MEVIARERGSRRTLSEGTPGSTNVQKDLRGKGRASQTLQQWKNGKLKVVGSLVQVEIQAARLRRFVPLVEKVIAQTTEREIGRAHV